MRDMTIFFNSKYLWPCGG